jgi:hypothetical protein
MRGFHTSWFSKATFLAASCVMLSIAVAPPASGAERRAHGSNAQPIEQGTRPVTRLRAYGDGADRSSECVGGYRWINQFYDSNLTEGQVSVPVRCR